MTAFEQPAAEWVAIDSLREWANNPRKNDGTPVDKVVESIRRFGFGSPILARLENGEVIAGHTRLKAAKVLGLNTVPVRYLDLTETEAHALALADNRVGEEATWDDAMLKNILESMRADDVLLDGIGFDDGEINRLLSEKGINDPNLEWVGMPECEAEDQLAWKALLVNFTCEADYLAFGELIGQPMTKLTRSVWFPKAEIGHVADKAYGDEP